MRIVTTTSISKGMAITHGDFACQATTSEPWVRIGTRSGMSG